MVKTRIGKLAPRYSFMLNPHTEVRLSKCPKCRKATHLWDDQSIVDIKDHYEYLMNHEDILSKLKGLSSKK